MKQWKQALYMVVALIVAGAIGCSSPTGVPSETTAPASAEAEADETDATEGLTSDDFDKPEASMFEVKEPHKLDAGLLHLQASQDETILLASTMELSDKGYTASAQVMPPGVGERVGIAFAVRGSNTRGLFYLYRAAGADPFVLRCSVGVDVMIAGREARDPDIRVRELNFKKDTPIKLSVRQVGPGVFLSINDQSVGRLNERTLKVGQVGVYAKSQHADGSTATAKFDRFEIE